MPTVGYSTTAVRGAPVSAMLTQCNTVSKIQLRGRQLPPEIYLPYPRGESWRFG